jgi:hypothetical protein
MLSLLARLALIVMLAVIVTGCSAITGIFKAGFWTGLILAAIVIVAVVALLKR